MAVLASWDWSFFFHFARSAFFFSLSRSIKSSDSLIIRTTKLWYFRDVGEPRQKKTQTSGPAGHNFLPWYSGRVLLKRRGVSFFYSERGWMESKELIWKLYAKMCLHIEGYWIKRGHIFKFWWNCEPLKKSRARPIFTWPHTKFQEGTNTHILKRIGVSFKDSVPVGV